MLKLITISFVLLTQQEPSNQLLTSCVTQFASKVGIQVGQDLLVQRSTSTATGMKRYAVIANSKIFMVEKTGRFVVQYSDSQKSSGNVLPLTIDSYKNKARQLAAGLAYVSHASSPVTRTSQLSEATKEIYVTINEKVDGVDNRGAGNRLSFGFSTITGKLMSFSASLGYSYFPRQVDISKEEAIDRAKSLYRNHFGKSFTGSASVILGYAPIVSGFETTSFEDRRTRRLVHYCYIVQLGHSTIYVDSRNGASLGGVTSKLR